MMVSALMVFAIVQMDGVVSAVRSLCVSLSVTQVNTDTVGLYQGVVLAYVNQVTMAHAAPLHNVLVMLLSLELRLAHSLTVSPRYPMAMDSTALGR